MKIKSVRLALLRFREGSKKIAADRDIERALAALKKYPELDPVLDAQKPLDALVNAAVSAVRIPDSAQQKFETLGNEWRTSPASQQFSFRNPAILSVVVSFLILAFLGTWLYLSRSQTYPGATEVEAVLDAERNADTVPMEHVVTDIGSLGDWFTMKSFDGYFVPSGFEGMKTAGARVFSFQGQHIAMVTISQSKWGLLVFPANPFGIQIEPAGVWKIEKTEEETFAVQVLNDMCFIVFPRDKKSAAALPDFIRQLSEAKKL
ncbi:MAG: hypothetical protein ABI443_08190 [Chthoniobacterales bacterium]